LYYLSSVTFVYDFLRDVIYREIKMDISFIIFTSHR
jgi:hypothetical protein